MDIKDKNILRQGKKLIDKWKQEGLSQADIAERLEVPLISIRLAEIGAKIGFVDYILETSGLKNSHITTLLPKLNSKYMRRSRIKITKSYGEDFWNECKTSIKYLKKVKVLTNANYGTIRTIEPSRYKLSQELKKLSEKSTSEMKPLYASLAKECSQTKRKEIEIMQAVFMLKSYFEYLTDNRNPQWDLIADCISPYYTKAKGKGRGKKLSSWWNKRKDDFAMLNGKNIMLSSLECYKSHRCSVTPSGS